MFLLAEACRLGQSARAVRPAPDNKFVNRWNDVITNDEEYFYDSDIDHCNVI